MNQFMSDINFHIILIFWLNYAEKYLKYQRDDSKAIGRVY